MICPKCKTKNPNTAVICSDCKLKLKLACPFCSEMNKLGQIICASCKKNILKVCTQCKALNRINAETCRKCATKLEAIEDNIKVISDISLPKFAVLSAELINYPAVMSKTSDNEIFRHIIAKFHQIFAKQAKQYSQKAKKMKDNIMLIEYKCLTSTDESTEAALNSALTAMKDIKVFNEFLLSKYQISLKIKIGIVFSSKQQPSLANQERLIANADEIVLNKEFENVVKDKFIFEKFKSQTGIEYLKLVEKIETETKSQQEIAKVSNFQEYNNRSEKTYYSRKEVFQTILSKINDTTDGQIVAITGQDGIGKSSILFNLRNVFDDNDNIFWLLGDCDPARNLIPFSYFQNLFKALFSLPQQNINIEESKKIITEFLSNQIGILDTSLQNRIISIIFPDKSNLATHIYFNKEQTMQAIQTVLEQIFKKQKTVVIIEDIEDIDAASLECIRKLLNQGILSQNIKFLISGNLNIDIKTFMHIDALNESNTTTLPLSGLSSEEIDDAISGMINDKNILPLSLRKQLYENSKGFPVYFEQALMLLIQTGVISINKEKSGEFVVSEQIKEIRLPQDASDLIKIRLNNIAKMSSNAFKFVCYAAILGYKFLPALVKNILAISEQEFNEIIEMLLLNGIFTTFDNYNFTFKNKTLWKVFYNIELSPENKTACYTDINEGLIKYTTPNTAIIAENFIKIDSTSQHAADYIEQAAQEAYSAGDDYAYTELKSKILDYLENTTIENKDYIKYGIYEELGKLNFLKNPNEAIKYLTEVIKYYEDNQNITKVIDLSGFLAKSCEVTGNYSNAVECTDKAIEMVDKDTMPYEYAFLIYSKLEHLMNLGRFEELIVFAGTTVLPALEAINKTTENINALELSDIKFIELDTRYIVAKTMAMQGNKECLKEAEILLEIANQNKNGDFAVKAHLVIALFKTLQGQSTDAKAILEGLKNLIPKANDYWKNIIEWQFLNILDNLFTKNYDVLKQDLQSAVNFSVNTGAYFYQPLFKGIWGKMLVENNEIARANDIYYELIQFCSENKLATGALAIWYLIAEAEMKLQNFDKALDVAEKALEVAQNPMINHYFFIMLFKKMLAEIYLAKIEIDMASMYAEQAMQLVQNLDLTLWEIKLSLLCGQIFKTKALIEKTEKTENAQNAQKMHLAALELSKKISNKNIAKEIENSINELNQFCVKEGISI